MDCRDDSEERQQRGMGVGLSGHRIEDHMGLANKGVREEAVGESRGICSRDTNILTLYRRRSDGGTR